MKKEERITKYGERAYAKLLVQSRKWYSENQEEVLESRRKWRDANPEESCKGSRNQSRRGGKYYSKARAYESTGLRAKRRRIRMKHANRWRRYKKIIAPGSQLHHQWRPGTDRYSGLALVETDQHMNGFIDVIKILEGEITLFSEKEIRG